jgi:hypothetical protein
VDACCPFHPLLQIRAAVLNDPEGFPRIGFLPDLQRQTVIDAEVAHVEIAFVHF